MAKTLQKFGLGFLAIVALSIVAQAGPVPYTASQFPTFYAGQNTIVTNTGTVETNLAQIAIPHNVVGNNGSMDIDLFVSSPDAVAVAHTYTTYIGGSGNPVTGGTAIATNSVGADSDVRFRISVLPMGSTTNLYVTAYSTTNSFAGYGQPFVKAVFDASTNFNLTVTGKGAFSTNVFRLNCMQVRATAIP